MTWDGNNRRREPAVIDEIARERTALALKLIAQHEAECGERWRSVQRMLVWILMSTVGGLIMAVAWLLRNPGATILPGG